MDPAVIVSVIGGAFSIASTIYVGRQARQASRDKAEQAAREARLAAEDGAYQRASAFDVSTQTRMQGEINRLQRQVAYLQKQVAQLTRQVTQAGLEPVMVPEEDPLA
ncbi:hypothetical protein OIE13_05925 [Streptosporangium sp. NBC_01810]|uniref:hypothetical protein n=1 Tax=Streptosporangium sp. NBC_01810 TaxID=2975951 RepID=UPI002DDADBB4|nr:hypothetical protein [Streptosporangium sp. NBC_01810]WSA27411.1 hypothetical protein OIE13_05925 [Streptosporangium sp. NBC_01810]